jgi:Nucleotidyltransferase domain.
MGTGAKMGTKVKAGPVAFSLFGKARGAILSLLFGRGDETFYLRQIVRAVGAGQGAVQRELKALSEAGIIERTERDRQVYYHANSRCPIYPELRGLMTKTCGLAHVIADALSRLEEEIDVAFIYGSQADGTSTVASDVDLMIVGSMDGMAVHKALKQAEKELGRSVNYTLLTRKELARRRKEKGGFIDRVASGAKIAIIGEIDEI